MLSVGVLFAFPVVDWPVLIRVVPRLDVGVQTIQRLKKVTLTRFVLSDDCRNVGHLDPSGVDDVPIIRDAKF